MSAWRVMLKKIASKPLVPACELYSNTSRVERTWHTLDWLQGHRLVRSIGIGSQAIFCATVLGDHVAKGIVPLVRPHKRGGKMLFIQFPSGQLKRLTKNVDRQPGWENV